METILLRRVWILAPQMRICCHAMLDWQFLYQKLSGGCDFNLRLSGIDCWTTNWAIQMVCNPLTMVPGQPRLQEYPLQGFSEFFMEAWHHVNHASQPRTPFASKGNDVPNQMVPAFSAWQDLVSPSLSLSDNSINIFLLHSTTKRLHLLDEPLQPSVLEILRWIYCCVQTFGISMALCLDQFQVHLPIRRSPRTPPAQSHLISWSNVSPIITEKTVNHVLRWHIPFELGTSCFSRFNRFELRRTQSLHQTPSQFYHRAR